MVSRPQNMNVGMTGFVHLNWSVLVTLATNSRLLTTWWGYYLVTYPNKHRNFILLVLIWLQTVHECYQQMTKVLWSVVSKNGIYLGSAGQRLIWYLCKCIYYSIVTLFVSTSIHFYFTLLVGNYLGILSSAVFSKLIYYIVPSLSLSESQTVWIQIRSDILSVLIWF